MALSFVVEQASKERTASDDSGSVAWQNSPTSSRASRSSAAPLTAASNFAAVVPLRTTRPWPAVREEGAARIAVAALRRRPPCARITRANPDPSTGKGPRQLRRFVLGATTSDSVFLLSNDPVPITSVPYRFTPTPNPLPTGQSPRPESVPCQPPPSPEPVKWQPQIVALCGIAYDSEK